jgi:uncharacterized protein YbjT (DUF2867 family)
MRIAVCGATGMTGRRVLISLLERGHAVVAVGWNAERLARLDPRAERRIGDLYAPETLPAAFAGVDAVINLAHARHTARILGALPDPATRLVVVGSTRLFSSVDPAAAAEIADAVAAFENARRPGCVLLPTMIYGPKEDSTVGRLLRLVAALPRGIPVPVPMSGMGWGRTQPVHVDDVVHCVSVAAENPGCDGPPVVLAGPESIGYPQMLRFCARALDRSCLSLPIPFRAVVAVAARLRQLGVGVPFDPDELARSAEAMVFNVAPMRARFGSAPRDFEAGLARKVAERAY